MNIALEQTEEYVNGQLKNKYGDAFIRGNNGNYYCKNIFFQRIIEIKLAQMMLYLIHNKGQILENLVILKYVKIVQIGTEVPLNIG